MSKSCRGLATELVKCLSASDCVKVEKRSFRECAGEESPSVPSECVGLRETYLHCKRRQVVSWFSSPSRQRYCLYVSCPSIEETLVDMTSRIRGNKGYYELHLLGLGPVE